MQRLNIPLRRHHSTTRLSRRVVSLVGVLVGAGCAAFILLGSIWYGRDTTSASAPEGTRLVLHFSPNRLTWDDTERALGSIPLVSDRPLTVADIRPFTRGEFSVFVGEDGTRSIAVRADRSDVPTQTLDALGVIAQETSRGVHLLSNKPMARMGWEPGRVWFGFVHWPNATHIGSVHLVEEEAASGAIYMSGRGVSLRLTKQSLAKIPWKSLPISTIAALSTPMLQSVSLGDTTDAIVTILSPYDTPSAAWIVRRLLTFPGQIIISRTNDALDFLFVASSDDFAKSQQQKIIQTAVALENPRIQALILPDNTHAQEIVVEPSLTTIEETSVAGTLVSRAATSNGRYLYTAEKAETFAVTSSQALLEHWLKDPKAGETVTCPGNVAYLDLRTMLELSAKSLAARSAHILHLVADQYSVLSIQENWLSTTINACF